MCLRVAKKKKGGKNTSRATVPQTLHSAESTGESVIQTAQTEGHSKRNMQTIRRDWPTFKEEIKLKQQFEGVSMKHVRLAY